MFVQSDQKDAALVGQWLSTAVWSILRPHFSHQEALGHHLLLTTKNHLLTSCITFKSSKNTSPLPPLMIISLDSSRGAGHRLVPGALLIDHDLGEDVDDLLGEQDDHDLGEQDEDDEDDQDEDGDKHG